MSNVDVILTQTLAVIEEVARPYSYFVWSCLLGSITVCSILLYIVQKKTQSDLPSTTNVHFRTFQNRYFIVYFLVLFGDWLQGPYIYKLYSHYGYTEFQIAILYVVGFSSSVLFGTFTGYLADRFGRKRMCMVFCLTYSLCCLLKLSPDYNVLLIGRLLGGISTSLLFSVFESWYVYEHIQRYDFPQEWISITFSKATFWNGFLAILAGIAANFTSDILDLGPVSPFILAIPCFLFGSVIVAGKWNENYGLRKTTSKNVCMEGLQVVLNNKLILMLGGVQSLFESVMYVFVFLWTPILDKTKPPLGIVFSTFMVFIMIGSLIYQLGAYNKMSPDALLSYAVFLATVSQFGCLIATGLPEKNILLAYVSFFLMETSVGLYFPAIGYIKSECIPESHRANIMNWFRVPLNVLTCILLLSLHRDAEMSGTSTIFILCTAIMLFCMYLMTNVRKMLPTVQKSVEGV